MFAPSLQIDTQKKTTRTSSDIDSMIERLFGQIGYGAMPSSGTDLDKRPSRLGIEPQEEGNISSKIDDILRSSLSASGYEGEIPANPLDPGDPRSDNVFDFILQRAISEGALAEGKATIGPARPKEKIALRETEAKARAAGRMPMALTPEQMTRSTEMMFEREDIKSIDKFAQVLDLPVQTMTGFLNGLFWGIPKAALGAAGLETPEARTTAGKIGGGLGELGGMIGPGVAAGAARIVGKIGAKTMIPGALETTRFGLRYQPGSKAFELMMDLVEASKSGILKASPFSITGKLADKLFPATKGAGIVREYLKSMARGSVQLSLAAAAVEWGGEDPDAILQNKLQAFKGGAIAGALFPMTSILHLEKGGFKTLSWILRAGVNSATLDAVNGTTPWDERNLTEKAYQYGLNAWFSRVGTNLKGIRSAFDESRRFDAEARAAGSPTNLSDIFIETRNILQPSRKALPGRPAALPAPPTGELPPPVISAPAIGERFVKEGRVTIPEINAAVTFIHGRAAAGLKVDPYDLAGALNITPEKAGLVLKRVNYPVQMPLRPPGEGPSTRKVDIIPAASAAPTMALDVKPTGDGGMTISFKPPTAAPAIAPTTSAAPATLDDLKAHAKKMIADFQAMIVTTDESIQRNKESLAYAAAPPLPPGPAAPSPAKVEERIAPFRTTPIVPENSIFKAVGEKWIKGDKSFIVLKISPTKPHTAEVEENNGKKYYASTYRAWDTGWRPAAPAAAAPPLPLGPPPPPAKVREAPASFAAPEAVKNHSMSYKRGDTVDTPSGRGEVEAVIEGPKPLYNVRLRKGDADVINTYSPSEISFVSRPETAVPPEPEKTVPRVIEGEKPRAPRPTAEETGRILFSGLEELKEQPLRLEYERGYPILQSSRPNAMPLIIDPTRPVGVGRLLSRQTRGTTIRIPSELTAPQKIYTRGIEEKEVPVEVVFTKRGKFWYTTIGEKEIVRSSQELARDLATRARGAGVKRSKYVQRRIRPTRIAAGEGTLESAELGGGAPPPSTEEGITSPSKAAQTPSRQAVEPVPVSSIITFTTPKGAIHTLLPDSPKAKDWFTKAPEGTTVSIPAELTKTGKLADLKKYPDGKWVHEPSGKTYSPDFVASMIKPARVEPAAKIGPPAEKKTLTPAGESLTEEADKIFSDLPKEKGFSWLRNETDSLYPSGPTGADIRADLYSTILERGEDFFKNAKDPEGKSVPYPESIWRYARNFARLRRQPRVRKDKSGKVIQVEEGLEDTGATKRTAEEGQEVPILEGVSIRPGETGPSFAEEFGRSPKGKPPGEPDAAADEEAERTAEQISAAKRERDEGEAKFRKTIRDAIYKVSSDDLDRDIGTEVLLEGMSVDNFVDQRLGGKKRSTVFERVKRLRTRLKEYFERNGIKPESGYVSLQPMRDFWKTMEYAAKKFKDKFLVRYFTYGRGLPTELVNAFDRATQGIRSSQYKGAIQGKAIMKYLKSVDNDPDARRTIIRALRGEIPVDQVGGSQEVQQMLYDFRMLRRDLGLGLVEYNPAANEAWKETVLDNLLSYLTRSYRLYEYPIAHKKLLDKIFGRDIWNPDSEARRAWKNVLLEWWPETYENFSAEDMEGELDAILRRTVEPSSVQYSTGRRVKSIRPDVFAERSKFGLQDYFDQFSEEEMSPQFRKTIEKAMWSGQGVDQLLLDEPGKAVVRKSIRRREAWEKFAGLIGDEAIGYLIHRTITKQATGRYLGEFYKNVHDNFKGKLWDTEPLSRRWKNYTITGDSRWGVFNQYEKIYVHPVLHSFLKNDVAINEDKLYRLAEQLIVNPFKAAKVIGSAPAYSRNGFGNIFFSIIGRTPIYNPKHWIGRESPYRKSLRTMKGRRKAGGYEDWADLIEAGPLETQFVGEEIPKHVGTSIELDPVRWLDAVMFPFRKSFSVAGQLFNDIDIVFKLAGFYNQVDNLGKTPEQAIVEIDAAYANYRKASPAVELLRKIPIFGTFVSFPANVVKVGMKQLQMAGSEIRHGASYGKFKRFPGKFAGELMGGAGMEPHLVRDETGEPVAEERQRIPNARVEARGWHRLLTLGMAVAIPYVIRELFMKLFDIDPLTLKKIEEGRAAYERHGVFVPFRTASGKVKEVSLTYVWPTGDIVRGITALTKGDWAAFGEAINTLDSPLVYLANMLSTGRDPKNNQRVKGIEDFFARVLREIYIPTSAPVPSWGTIKNFFKTGKVEPRAGALTTQQWKGILDTYWKEGTRLRSMADEVLGFFTGFRPVLVDPEQISRSAAGSAGAKLRDLTTEFNTWKRQHPNSPAWELEAKTSEYEKRRTRIQAEVDKARGIAGENLEKPKKAERSQVWWR